MTAVAAAAVLAASPASASPIAGSVGSASVGSASLAAAAPMASLAQAVSFDAQMVQLVNRARASVGAPAVTEAKGLTQLSVWWSSQMQNGSTGYNLQHNPNAWTMVTSYGASNRTSWGENVAWSSSTGTTAAQLFTAYMNSPDHKANILAPNYRFIGMGTVTGAHGLFNTTEFTNAVDAGQAVVPAPVVTAAVPRNGEFFRDASTNSVFRMAGGAPIAVHSWTPFGGVKPTKLVAHTTVARLPQYPADGTYLRTAGVGAVFKVVGGAPVYVSRWAAMGGVFPTTDVDPLAISYAGSSGNWSHLRAYPVDGTFVRTTSDGAVYRMSGGAPLWVSSWAAIGGVKPAIAIDAAAVSHGGMAGVWSHLKWHPADNAYLQSYGRPNVYRVISGKAIPVAGWASVGGVKPVTAVPQNVIALAGLGGRFNHLLPR
ncbi:uncharacterized protein YkwD [Nakamurella sp. UYEF19]|uniref:CAP domain-containing protein n=1 Tax=Nakamurella sp. UYEF19 TaxID=1756392 RepID=UPI00339B51B7